jgi:hypothetical protein
MVAPSGTWIGPNFALRAAIMNHRSTAVDIDHLIQQVLILGDKLREH